MWEYFLFPNFHFYVLLQLCFSFTRKNEDLVAPGRMPPGRKWYTKQTLFVAVGKHLLALAHTVYDRYPQLP